MLLSIHCSLFRLDIGKNMITYGEFNSIGGGGKVERS